MGKPAPMARGGGGLSDAREIMMIMRVLLVEFLCQAAMGQTLVLKYLVIGARGCLWLCPIMPAFKWCYFTRSRPHWCLPDIGEPLGMTTWGLGQVTRRIYSGQLSGEILTIRGYCDG
jgi:hypothetical protein